MLYNYHLGLADVFHRERCITSRNRHYGAALLSLTSQHSEIETHTTGYWYVAFLGGQTAFWVQCCCVFCFFVFLCRVISCHRRWISYDVSDWASLWLSCLTSCPANNVYLDGEVWNPWLMLCCLNCLCYFASCHSRWLWLEKWTRILKENPLPALLKPKKESERVYPPKTCIESKWLLMQAWGSFYPWVPSKSLCQAMPNAMLASLIIYSWASQNVSCGKCLRLRAVYLSLYC